MKWSTTSKRSLSQMGCYLGNALPFIRHRNSHPLQAVLITEPGDWRLASGRISEIKEWLGIFFMNFLIAVKPTQQVVLRISETNSSCLCANAAAAAGKWRKMEGVKKMKKKNMKEERRARLIRVSPICWKGDIKGAVNMMLYFCGV